MSDWHDIFDLKTSKIGKRSSNSGSGPNSIQAAVPAAYITALGRVLRAMISLPRGRRLTVATVLPSPTSIAKPFPDTRLNAMNFIDRRLAKMIDCEKLQ